MKVKIKKLHEKAIIPQYAKDGDAGVDLVATSFLKSRGDNYIEFGTGLSIEIPEGYVGLLFPRSSISKTCLVLANSVGVIDSSYRGEIKLRFKQIYEPLFDNELYTVGDKVGQLIILPYPQIDFEEVKELSETERGENGFGSTGK